MPLGQNRRHFTFAAIAGTRDASSSGQAGSRAVARSSDARSRPSSEGLAWPVPYPVGVRECCPVGVIESSCISASRTTGEMFAPVVGVHVRVRGYDCMCSTPFRFYKAGILYPKDDPWNANTSIAYVPNVHCSQRCVTAVHLLLYGCRSIGAPARVCEGARKYPKVPCS